MPALRGYFSKGMRIVCASWWKWEIFTHMRNNNHKQTEIWDVYCWSTRYTSRGKLSNAPLASPSICFSDTKMFAASDNFPTLSKLTSRVGLARRKVTNPVSTTVIWLRISHQKQRCFFFSPFSHPPRNSIFQNVRLLDEKEIEYICTPRAPYWKQHFQFSHVPLKYRTQEKFVRSK